MITDELNKAGFYRVDGNDLFQYAANFVHGPGYSIFKEEKDTYTYPTEGGWVWHNTEEEARIYFNKPKPDPI